MPYTTLELTAGSLKNLFAIMSIVEINGDRAVFACHFGGLAHVSSPCRWLSVQRRHGEGNPLQEQAYGERIGASPLNPMECDSGHRHPAREQAAYALQSGQSAHCD